MAAADHESSDLGFHAVTPSSFPLQPVGQVDERKPLGPHIAPARDSYDGNQYHELPTHQKSSPSHRANHPAARPLHTPGPGYHPGASKPSDGFSSAHGEGYHNDGAPSRPAKAFNESKKTKKSEKSFVDSILNDKRVEKIIKYSDYFGIVSESITTLFSSLMLAFLLFTYIRFSNSKDYIANGRGPWPKETKTWPSIVIIVASLVTLIVSLIVLVKYFINFRKGQKSWKLTLARYAVHVWAWITIAALYKIEKGLNGVNSDLWSWSCSQQASLLQEAFKDVINFDSLCGLQVWSLNLPAYSPSADRSCGQTKASNLSIAEAAVKMVFALISIVFWRKMKKEEKTDLADQFGDGAYSLIQQVL